jgi:glycosyltransferase involved in cell wall biosynthesis
MLASASSSELDVRLICHDLGTGGAARATARIATAIREHGPSSGIRLTVRPVFALGHSLADMSGYPGGWITSSTRTASQLVRHRVWDRLPWGTENPALHSRADVRTGIGRETNRAVPDVVNLHWLGTGTMSIGEVGHLRSPVVMTLHDMWAFTGAEHYVFDRRFEAGYLRGTRPDGEAGIDWNRLVWRRKHRAWRRPMHIITPSRWLADCVGRSRLMSDWPTTVIPYPLDTEFWRPGDQLEARKLLGLPSGRVLVLFGADGGASNPIKGGDLLDVALQRLPGLLGPDLKATDVEFVVFGGETRSVEPSGRLPFVTHHLGRLLDDRLVRAAYLAADVMVVPSRLEALGQTGSEAQACGVPVVAFDVAGQKDVVEDRESGRLARPYDSADLAAAIAWVLADESRMRRLGSNARSVAIARYAPQNVSDAYADVFRAVTTQKP